MEIQVLFATFDPIVGMLESIPIDPIIILASIKQKPKKLNIVKKFQTSNLWRWFGLKHFLMLVGIWQQFDAKFVPK